MTRWMHQLTRIWKEDTMYLQMMIVCFFLIPIAYFMYLSMSASILNLDIMTLLTQSSVEGINLLVNISMFYGAFVIRHYMHHGEERASLLAMGILFLSQICFLNPFTCFLFILYVNRFIGWKECKEYYCGLHKGIQWKALLPALLVLFIGIITFALKIKLQILF